MNHIDKYKFGEMIIDGKSYTGDLMITPHEIIQNWWRKEGHRCALADLEKLPVNEIECLIIGTGKFGMMKVDDDVIRHFKQQQIEIIISKTKSAVTEYNNMLKQKQVAAAFHLTC